MLNTGTHCKAYDKLQDEARKSDDFKNLEQQYQVHNWCLVSCGLLS